MRAKAYSDAAPSSGFADGSTDSPTTTDQVRAEKEAALREPGPGWREWFFHSALRWYYALGVLIVNVQLIVFWMEYGSAVGLAITLVAICYGEFVLYRYLWYRPHPDSAQPRKFRRSWLQPRAYGRWTPEADLARAKARAGLADEGPSAKEFL